MYCIKKWYFYASFFHFLLSFFFLLLILFLELLFSDKTGTLTFNSPSLGDPVLAPGFDGGPSELFAWAALTCQSVMGDVINGLFLGAVEDKEALFRRYDVIKYV